MRRALAVLAVVMFAGSGPDGRARAQGLAPACGPRTRGVLACMAGQVCACDWYQGGSITDHRAGWRWACRIEQMCGTPAPADGDASFPSSFPPPPYGGEVEMP